MLLKSVQGLLDVDAVASGFSSRSLLLMSCILSHFFFFFLKFYFCYLDLMLMWIMMKIKYLN